MLNKLGDRMAGHKNLKKMHAEIKLSLMSWRPEPFIRSRNLVKHSRSSLKQNQHNEIDLQQHIIPNGQSITSCTYNGNDVCDDSIWFHVVSTAFLRFACCLAKLDALPAFKGSTSQSKPVCITFDTSSLRVSCKYLSPVNFKYASIALVASELPLNVNRSSSTFSISIITMSDKNSLAKFSFCMTCTKAVAMSSLALTPTTGSRISQMVL